MKTTDIKYQILVSGKNEKKHLKGLQALHHSPPLHLYQASTITLSKKTSKGRYISLSLNIINIDACTCVNFKMFNGTVSFFFFFVHSRNDYFQ